MAIPFEIQLEGSIRFTTVDSNGLAVTGSYVDFGTEISSLVVGRTRQTIERKPTFADARSVQRAGALVEQLTTNFLGDETNATGFIALVWTALETPPCELAFAARVKPGAIGATNPEYRGIVLVSDLDVIGTVGESKWQSKTWPARNITKVTS